LFIIAYVCNLYINVGVYFELFVVMAEVGNLHAKLEGYFIFFIMAVEGNFLINYNRSNG
jgi:hypothetical protein